MATYQRPGFWKCDKITGKRIKWIPPQSIDITPQPMTGIGRGGNHKVHDLVLVETLTRKRFLR